MSHKVEVLITAPQVKLFSAQNYNLGDCQFNPIRRLNPVFGYMPLSLMNTTKKVMK